MYNTSNLCIIFAKKPFPYYARACGGEMISQGRKFDKKARTLTCTCASDAFVFWNLIIWSWCDEEAALLSDAHVAVFQYLADSLYCGLCKCSDWSYLRCQVSGCSASMVKGLRGDVFVMSSHMRCLTCVFVWVKGLIINMRFRVAKTMSVKLLSHAQVEGCIVNRI